MLRRANRCILCSSSLRKTNSYASLPYLYTKVAYLYTKVRSEFGKHCSFKDVPAFLLETVPSTEEYGNNYVTRKPGIAELDTSPHMSGTCPVSQH